MYSLLVVDAILAQLVERVTCNLEVSGSIPGDGLSSLLGTALRNGEIPEWSKGADCKSVGSAFEGSNPSLSNRSPYGGLFFIIVVPEELVWQMSTG